MGVDIEGITEIKIDGEWRLWAQWKLDRDYDLFSLLAGVRSRERKPVVAPRGLPGDLSMAGALLAELSRQDGHTHTWLAIAEMETVGERFQKLLNEEPRRNQRRGEWTSVIDPAADGFGGGLSYLKEGLAREAQRSGFEVTEVRCVFWFFG